MRSFVIILVAVMLCAGMAAPVVADAGKLGARLDVTKLEPGSADALRLGAVSDWGSLERQDGPEEAEASPASCAWYTNTCEIPYYIWALPSTSNPRTRNAEGFDGYDAYGQPCTLKTVSVVIYDWVDTSTKLDVRVGVWTDSLGLPGHEIVGQTIPAAVVDAYLYAWLDVDVSAYGLVLSDEFHVVMSVPSATPGVNGVYVLSDGGSDDPINCPKGASNARGSIFLSSTQQWYSHATAYGGFQFGTFFSVYLCCPPPPPMFCLPGSETQWETQGNGIARTNASSATVSDLCNLTRLWTAEPGGYVQGIQPVMAGDYVLVSATDSLHCYHRKTGTHLWAFGGFPYVIGDLRGSPTVDLANNRVYTGGVAAQSFSCLNLANGTVIWSRNVLGIDPPFGPLNTGATGWTSSILSGGYVYFTQETGLVVKLSATTGLDGPGSPILLPDVGSSKVAYNGLTSNGTKLWVGDADPIATSGSIYQIDMASFTIDWQLTNPSFIFTGDIDHYEPEGFPGTMAYEDGILYYHSLIRDDVSGFSHQPQSGALGAIDVFVENGTGNGILWVNPWSTGPVASPGTVPSSYNYSGPAIGPEAVYTTARGYFGGTSEPDGVAAYDKITGMRSWYSGYSKIGDFSGIEVLDDVRSDVPASVLCGTDLKPYVFTSHVGGMWRLYDGATGAMVWERMFTGRQRGTAVVDGYVATTTLNGGPLTGGGSVTMFAVSGARPRLKIDSQYVYRSLSPGSPPATDVISDALSNMGCADLNVSFSVSDTPPLLVSAVHPGLASSAERATRGLSGYDGWFDRFAAKRMRVDRLGGIESDGTEDRVRKFAENVLTAAAATVFLTVNTGPSVIAPSGSQSLSITYDPSGLLQGSSYINYISIASNDPDYFPQDPGGTVIGDPAITVQLMVGCPDAADYMTLGRGEEWITNYGALSDGYVNGFHVNGNNYHYDGTLWAVATNNTMWAIEGLSVGGAPRRPQEFGGAEPCGVTITAESTPNALGGTDSYETATNNIIDLASTNGYFPAGIRQIKGIELEVQRVGSQDASYGDFGLARVKVTNEVDGYGPLADLYVGVAEDWDIRTYTGNNTHAYVAEGYYACDDGAALGRGAAGAACGNARLDGPGVGTVSMGSGGAPTFMMGDFFGDQGVHEPFAIASDPYNYVDTYRPGAVVQNTDVGVYYSMIHIPSLAEGDSTEFYYCTWQLDNGVNGLPWSDTASYDAAVAEVVWRARAYAGFAKGDLDGNGILNAADLVALDSILLCLTTPSGGRVYTADVDADNTYSRDDYDLLAAVIAGTQPESALGNAWRFGGASSCGVGAPPQLAWPPDGATVPAASVTCQWADVCDAVSYQFQLDTNAAFTTLLDDATVGVSERALGSLPSGETFYWRVRTTNACGTGAWRGGSFTTEVGCPVVITGDVNVDGSITSADIIYLVTYVFKGGPPPAPCAAAGDVNCDGAVTSADIIYLVTYVFKGGPPPCDVCTLIPGSWSCP